MDNWSKYKTNFNYIIINEDKHHVKNSVEKIFRKHTRLRSKIIMDYSGNKIWQINSIKIEQTDLGVLEKEDLGNFFQNLELGKYINHIFYFEFREKNYCVWYLNHIIADGYSISLIENEIAWDKNRILNNITLDWQFGTEDGEIELSNSYLSEWSKVAKNNQKILDEFYNNEYVIREVEFEHKNFEGQDKITEFIVRALSEFLQNDVAYTILLNRRTLNIHWSEIVGDLHEEIPQLYTFNTDFEPFKFEDKLTFINSNKYQDSPIQINYEVSESSNLFGQESIKSNVNFLLKTSSDRVLKDTLNAHSSQLFISVTETLEAINIEIVSRLNQTYFERFTDILRKYRSNYARGK